MKTSYDIMKILSIDDAKKFATKSDTKKIVIISGVTGQDGSFMVDYLLKNTDHEIFGGARRLSVHNHENIKHLEHEKRFHLINFDLTDAHSISQVISQLNPDYFINFAAQSFVKSSWDFPAQTWDTNTKGVLHILESIHLHAPLCRFYNAGSSEEFGDVSYSPQDENHPLRPRSPYGASKAAARQLVKVYRESYSMYAIQGWLFNHEGTRRGEEFVTRKITKAVGEISRAINKGEKFEPLELGNLDAKRDWSDAEDMVDAVWRMLNQDHYNEKLNADQFEEFPELYNEFENQKQMTQWTSKRVKEYVVAHGDTHSIREFVEKSFLYAGLKGYWTVKPSDPQSEQFHLFDHASVILVTINPAYYRPAEVEHLHGNADSIKKDLKWDPKVSFEQLVEKMTKHDM